MEEVQEPLRSGELFPAAVGRVDGEWAVGVAAAQPRQDVPAREGAQQLPVAGVVGAVSEVVDVAVQPGGVLVAFR
jgi:hypothetical protein